MVKIVVWPSYCTKWVEPTSCNNRKLLKNHQELCPTQPGRVGLHLHQRDLEPQPQFEGRIPVDPDQKDQIRVENDISQTFCDRRKR